MRRLPLLLVVYLGAVAGAEPPSYHGVVRLPYGLAGEGKSLAKGRYLAEVECKAGVCVLRFLEGKEAKLTLRGEPGGAAAHLGIPVMGAQFLRSSDDPVAPGQDRQFSKTGAAQYEEETREWKGVLRLYEAETGGKAWFLFQERGKGGEWKTVQFGVEMRK